MSIRTLVFAAGVLATIEDALREEKAIDIGVLGSLNAGLSHLNGREPGDAELLALQHIADQLIPSDIPLAPVESENQDLQAAPQSVPSLAPAPSEDEEGHLGPVSGGEPETAGDASEASQASVMPVAGEPAPAAEALFAPQEHAEAEHTDDAE